MTKWIAIVEIDLRLTPSRTSRSNLVLRIVQFWLFLVCQEIDLVAGAAAAARSNREIYVRRFQFQSNGNSLLSSSRKSATNSNKNLVRYSSYT